MRFLAGLRITARRIVHAPNVCIFVRIGRVGWMWSLKTGLMTGLFAALQPDDNDDGH